MLQNRTLHLFVKNNLDAEVVKCLSACFNDVNKTENVVLGHESGTILSFSYDHQSRERDGVATRFADVSSVQFAKEIEDLLQDFFKAGHVQPGFPPAVQAIKNVDIKDQDPFWVLSK